MNRRKLGKTGEMLSMVGFGGIVVSRESQEDANRYVSMAIDRGINYFDVAPSYGDAEERLGPALEPYRQDVFLACKTGKRDAQGAREELEQSLANLRTDHFDVYQLHAVKTDEDVQTILGPGGALETFVKARQEGKVRFLGFSAHSEEAAVALIDAFDFDTILAPFNWVCWNQGNFGSTMLAAAQGKDMGVLALKALAKRRWRDDEQPRESRRWTKTWYSPVDTYEEAELAIRFTLSLPITAAVSPGHPELLWWACDAADKFAPLTAEEQELVRRNSEGIPYIFPQDYR